LNFDFAGQFILAIACYAASAIVVLFRRNSTDALGAILAVVGSFFGINVAWSPNRFERLRWLQQGRLTLYLVYIFVTMMCGVVWAAVREYLK
jgi:hypothetical protein